MTVPVTIVVCCPVVLGLFIVIILIIVLLLSDFIHIPEQVGVLIELGLVSQVGQELPQSLGLVERQVTVVAVLQLTYSTGYEVVLALVGVDYVE